MDPAPFDQPERQAVGEISVDDNSDPAGVSQPGPDENPRSPTPGFDGGQDDPPGEPDDDEYEPL